MFSFFISFYGLVPYILGVFYYLFINKELKMKIGENLDFCIIKNPFSNEHRFLIFFTRKGKIDIDGSLAQEESYEKIRYVMSNFGMDEVDVLTFENTSNVIKTFDINIVNQKLQEIGFSYSKDFENALLIDLEKIINESSIFNYVDKKNETPTYSDKKIKDLSSTPSYQLPELGGKIVLYFYLFLECRFSKEGDGFLDLNGDFNQKDNSNTRNFLRIAKSEFIRIPSPNHNQIILQSLKTYSNFIEESSVLHKGVFKLAKPYQDSIGGLKIGMKEYYYNLLEVKRNVKPTDKITIEVNIDYYYDYMMDMSKKIRREYILECKKQISKEAVETELNTLKSKLLSKMEILAELEEYEKASVFKKGVILLDEKIDIIKKTEAEIISQREMFKNFSLL